MRIIYRPLKISEICHVAEIHSTNYFHCSCFEIFIALKKSIASVFYYIMNPTAVRSEGYVFKDPESDVPRTLN